MEPRYSVDADIARASTLPAAFYRDDAAFALARERVFARSWQWLGDLDDVAAPRSLSPRELLPGHLDEPLLLARDGSGTLRCLSNVCTHRGNLLVRTPCRGDQIRCAYHSRRFDLAGRMTFMPAFEGARDFPSSSDDLPVVPFATWAGFGFAALAPAVPFEHGFGDAAADLAALPLPDLRRDPSRDRDYEVQAHWALYVENYLEGLHIPFVHPALHDAVDDGSYATALHRLSSVQVAHARAGGTAFAATGPAQARVAAHYWWMFPNLMINAYPWGLSINHVQPLAPDRTRVAFRSYVADPTLVDRGAGSGLDAVEREDEAIVEAVQRGVRSRLYVRGRYSPTREQGVHHFHRLLCAYLRAPDGTAPA
ncbi:MAG TPA: SRPBCC family protein [Casimicrobiaceae bacterium]|nr:SRPBCC family protein [Casimicrobiaceae bacterium]